MTLSVTDPSSGTFAAARRAMIDSQLRTSGVNAPWVLAAVAAVPRENYVPEGMRDAAYIDRAIPLGDGRSLAAPLVHARMLEEAAPSKEDKVLLVGDGEGYLAALLRPLVGTLDAVPPAEAVAYKGVKDFTLIVIDGAIEQFPDTLVGRLRDRGRVVTGVVERGVTRIAVGQKVADAVSLLPVADIGMPVLGEFAAPKTWSF